MIENRYILNQIIKKKVANTHLPLLLYKTFRGENNVKSVNLEGDITITESNPCGWFNFSVLYIKRFNRRLSIIWNLTIDSRVDKTHFIWKIVPLPPIRKT